MEVKNAQEEFLYLVVHLQQIINYTREDKGIDNSTHYLALYHMLDSDWSESVYFPITPHPPPTSY